MDDIYRPEWLASFKIFIDEHEIALFSSQEVREGGECEYSDLMNPDSMGYAVGGKLSIKGKDYEITAVNIYTEYGYRKELSDRSIHVSIQIAVKQL